MDKRQKAIEELKKQMRQTKERLGPEGIKELERLAKGLIQPKPAAKPAVSDSVPYDKKAAAKALEMFLKDHPGPKGFQKQLLERLKKSDH